MIDASLDLESTSRTMNLSNPHAFLGAIGIITCFLTSCGRDANIRAMMPAQAVAVHRTGQPVQAVVINGSVQDKILPNIPSEDFKQALERSLVRSGLFTRVGGDGFRVEVLIASIKRSRVDEKLRVQMEVRYALRRRSLLVWRKTIRSSYEVPIYQVQADLARMREATEGAARENIAHFILLLDKQRL